MLGFVVCVACDLVCVLWGVSCCGWILMRVYSEDFEFIVCILDRFKSSMFVVEGLTGAFWV